jgi:hypothetical protein
MGGALTLGSLAASPDLACGAPFYGVNFGLFEASALATKPVQVSVLRPSSRGAVHFLRERRMPFAIVSVVLYHAAQGHFGSLDAMVGFSDAATAAKLEAELRAAAGTDAHHEVIKPATLQDGRIKETRKLEVVGEGERSHAVCHMVAVCNN